MGKRLKQQRRGKGSNAYTKPPLAGKADVMFPNRVQQGALQGEVIDFVDSPMHSSLLMKVRFEDMSEHVLIAPEGIQIGGKIHEGNSAPVAIGNILPLSNIPDGMLIYNVELNPEDGGKFARAAGSYATVVSHLDTGVSVLLPSKTTVELSNDCKAQIGVAAGGGAGVAPILRAGKSHYMHHAVNALWPRYRGVKGNPVDHPFGGKQHHKGASSMTSWNAPPGAKVGHIGASRVGRKKRG